MRWRGRAPDPAGGAHDAPPLTPDHLVGWGGVPPPQEPPHRRLDPRVFGCSLLGASFLAYTHLYFSNTPLGEGRLTFILLMQLEQGRQLANITRAGRQADS